MTQLERGDEGPGWIASIRGSNPVNSIRTTNLRGTARGTGRLGTLPNLASQRKRGFLLVLHCSELSCVLVSLSCTGTMHTFLYCVLLPFVGPVLNFVGAPKLAMTSILTNESGLGFASSNLKTIPVIPSPRYIGAISVRSRFHTVLGFAFLASLGAPKLVTTSISSYESGLGLFPPNFGRISTMAKLKMS